MLSGLSLAPVNAEAKQQSFKPFKMIFLPDTHVSFKETDDWILYKESFVIFQDVIKSIKTIPELDFMVFGGDLTDNDDKTLSDLPLFLDSIEDIGVKYFAILGDRDADFKKDYTKQDFCAEFRRNGFKNPELTYWSEQLSEKVLLIGLDTSVENKADCEQRLKGGGDEPSTVTPFKASNQAFEGKLSPEELLWLDNTLKSNPDKFTVIVMHHPAFGATDVDKTTWKRFVLVDCEQRAQDELCSPGDPFKASNQAENPDKFLTLINKYPQVKLVLSGHHHNYAVKNLNGKLFMSLPSVVTYPNSYKILKVYPDKVEVENKDISYKQIIKKAKNILVKTDYAKEFDAKTPKKVLKFQEGDKISKKRVFYFVP